MFSSKAYKFSENIGSENRHVQVRNGLIQIVVRNTYLGAQRNLSSNKEMKRKS